MNNYGMPWFSLVVERQNAWRKLEASGDEKLKVMKTGPTRPQKQTVRTHKTIACGQQILKVSVLWNF